MFAKYQRYFKTALLKQKITEQYPQIQMDINRLEHHFHHSLSLLRNHFLTAKWKVKSIDKVPWCVLFGGNDAGKTSLLLRSQLPFVLKRKIMATERVTPSEIFEFWATEGMCLIDVPGFYLERTQLIANLSYFNYLVNLLSLEKEIVHWVYVLSIDQLCDKNGMTVFVDHIQSLLTIWRQRCSRPLSLHITISKCDRIPGFVEFFSENSMEENAGSWGVNLQNRPSEQTLSEHFAGEFCQLIRKLNQRLITRLHRARGLEVRGMIKDFPLQMEKLHHLLLPYMNYLSTCNGMQVSGVYLSSAEQYIVSQLSSYRSRMLEHTSGSVPLRLLFDNEIKNEGYFIKQFFLHVLANLPVRPTLNKRYLTNKAKWWYTLSFIITLGVGSYFILF